MVREELISSAVSLAFICDLPAPESELTLIIDL